MNLLVIGDVHACLHTFKKLLDKHWDKKRDLLIQVGDLIDRGKFSPETVAYCKELELKFPENTVFIKGNHEFEIIKHYYNGPHHNWLRQCGKETMEQYENSNIELKDHIEWFSKMPLYWSNEKVFISHAGIAENCLTPFEETVSNSVIWNREKLKNLGKVQVVGHTPCENHEPFYDEKSNTWNIDTGAGYGGNLTAIRLTMNGDFLEVIKMSTLAEDSL